MSSGAISSSTIAMAILVLVAQGGLAEDRLGESAIGESSSPGDHQATSSDPDSHLAESEPLDSKLTESKDPDELVVGSEDPDEMVVGAERLQDHRGRSTGLQDLPNARAQVGEIERKTLAEARERERAQQLADEAAQPHAQDARSPASHEMDSRISTIHQAKQAVAEARKLSEQADAAYSEMMRRDYPRGEARLQIVDARDVAREALKAAEKRYDAALDGGGGPASSR